MPKKEQLSEEKIAGINYILSFFRDVSLLTSEHANYENIILELKTKYQSITSETKMSKDERDALLRQAQTVRFYIHKSYIQYQTIIKGLDKKFPKGIENSYKKLKEQFILVRDDLLDYVMKMNFALEEQIMKDLLKTTSSFVKEAYEEEQKTSS